MPPCPSTGSSHSAGLATKKLIRTLEKHTPHFN